MNGRPIADRYYDINHFDEGLTPFTGNFETEETSIWDNTEDKTVTFSQVDPLPLEILGIEVELQVSE
jgi:hypothetical protein